MINELTFIGPAQLGRLGNTREHRGVSITGRHVKGGDSYFVIANISVEE